MSLETLKHVAAIVAVSTAGAVPTLAVASPGSGVTPTSYVTSDLTEAVDFNHNRVKFQTKDPTTVRVQKLEFAPGGRMNSQGKGPALHDTGTIKVSLHQQRVEGNCAPHQTTSVSPTSGTGRCGPSRYQRESVRAIPRSGSA